MGFICENDSKKFIKAFKESSKHLGDYREQALDETNFLIKKLADRK